MITFVLVGLAVGMFFWIRYRWRLWVKERAARRTITAQERAKAKAAAKRRVMQRVHALLPDRTVRRLMRWTPETRPRPTARIARRGFRGRYVRVNPAQHILAVGMTGSGKTSTLRVLGAWALRTPGWHLEIFDAKYGASARPYRDKARVFDTMEAIEERLRDIVEREFPLVSGGFTPAVRLR